MDQNPVYYQYLADQNWRSAPVTNITDNIITWAHRRYGVSSNPALSSAWARLVVSSYSQDLSVQDDTGVIHFPGGDTGTFWENDRFTPKPVLCEVWHAWLELASIAPLVHPDNEPFRYDLVNLGREVLARLSSPSSQNASEAFTAAADADAITAAGSSYLELLGDLDSLLATDTAFMLGPWIASARACGANATDCGDFSCPDFMEWNARAQLTTWIPTPPGSTEIPGGPNDYAGKHWSGLISGYYSVRAAQGMSLALQAVSTGSQWNVTAWHAALADHAAKWQLATNPYPTAVLGDARVVTAGLQDKYAPRFAPYCGA